MKKIAIVAVLLLATSAFGAVSLKDLGGTTASSVPLGTPSIDLYVSADIPLAGVGIGLVADKPGLSVTAVSYPQAGWLSNAAVLPLPASLNGPDGTPDLGGQAIVDSAAGLNLIKLTISLPAVAGPVVIASNAQTYWFNADMSTFEFGQTNAYALNITPEPTTMLLLAGGAAFFARRRRA